MNSINNLLQAPSPIKGRPIKPILTDFHGKPKRRVVSHSANRAPSTSSYQNIHQATQEHSYMRVQMFMVRSRLFEGVGVNSDGTILENITCAPGHATQQQGKSGMKYHHAAHSNEGAGMVDNVKEAFVNDFHAKGQITPKKKRQLRLRNVSEVDIAKINNKLAQGLNVRQDLYKLWPGKRFLDNTKADDLLNATDVLPIPVNMIVDMGLENKVRKKSAKLTEEVIKGKKTALQVTREFVNIVKSILVKDQHKYILERNQLKKLPQLTKAHQKRLLEVNKIIGLYKDEIKGCKMPHKYLLR